MLEQAQQRVTSVMQGREVSAATSQYLTFIVNGEQYGVSIMTVREIKGWTSVTRLPNTPGYIRGVMNLRGIIVPIFDLKSRFVNVETEITPNSVIIILAVHDKYIGILVDAVSDILTVAADDIKRAPDVDAEAGRAFITGLISLDSRMVVLLDIEHLFDAKDFGPASPDGDAGALS